VMSGIVVDGKVSGAGGGSFLLGVMSRIVVNRVATRAGTAGGGSCLLKTTIVSSSSLSSMSIKKVGALALTHLVREDLRSDCPSSANPVTALVVGLWRESSALTVS
jgi:hypothetical protein